MRPAGCPGPRRARPVERQAIGDFGSRAEWTYPAEASGRLPAVILIAGSTSADLDFTVKGPDGQVRSRIFADLARALSARNIAVLRYNKHHVSGPGQVDYAAYYAKADLHTFLADAASALSAAERNPRVDPEVAGLIVQGPVTLPWRQLFEVQLPYLREVAPQGLNAGNIAAALQGPGGGVARSVVGYLLDPRTPAGQPPVISPLLDSNGDGTLQLNSEVVPGMPRVLDLAFSQQGFFSIYSPNRALPSMTGEVARLKQPALVLQGENDAQHPGRPPERAASRFWCGGHRFRPMAAQPMQDAADWVLAR